MHNKPVRPGRCHVAHRCRIYEIFPAYRPFGPEYFFPDNKILFSRPRISRYGGRIQQKSSYISATAFEYALSGGGSRGSRTPDPLLVRQTL